VSLGGLSGLCVRGRGKFEKPLCRAAKGSGGCGRGGRASPEVCCAKCMRCRAPKGGCGKPTRSEEERSTVKTRRKNSLLEQRGGGPALKSLTESILREYERRLLGFLRNKESKSWKELPRRKRKDTPLQRLLESYSRQSIP